jgi:hypothetical protein
MLCRDIRTPELPPEKQEHRRGLGRDTKLDSYREVQRDLRTGVCRTTWAREMTRVVPDGAPGIPPTHIRIGGATDTLVAVFEKFITAVRERKRLRGSPTCRSRANSFQAKSDDDQVSIVLSASTKPARTRAADLHPPDRCGAASS